MRDIAELALPVPGIILLETAPALLLLGAAFVLLVCAGTSARFAWALRRDRPWASLRHGVTAGAATLAVSGVAWAGATLSGVLGGAFPGGPLGLMAALGHTPALFAFALSGVVLSLVMLGLEVAPASVRGPWRIVMSLSLGAAALALAG